MIATNSNGMLLSSTSHTPIAQLSPSLESQALRSIKAVVTLTWPFSSSTNSIIFLLSEPDFRLRKDRGQVRVEFSGPSGNIVVKEEILNGDQLVLSLDGVEWIQDDCNILIPGKGIEYKLRFNRRLLLQFKRDGSGEKQEININYPREEIVCSDSVSVSALERKRTPVDFSNNSDQSTLNQIINGNNLYSSPAFLKRARISYGSLFDSGLDIFVETDGTALGKGRKKSRLSLNWGYKCPSPNSEEECEHNEQILEVIEPTFKPLQPVMVDEGVQTYTNDFDGRLESMESVKRSKAIISSYIPAIDNSLKQEELLEDHSTSTSQIVARNSDTSDPQLTENQCNSLSKSPLLLPISSESCVQLSQILTGNQSPINSNAEMIDTKSIVQHIKTNITDCTPEIDNQIEKPTSIGLEIDKDVTQNLNTAETLVDYKVSVSLPPALFEAEVSTSSLFTHPSSAEKVENIKLCSPSSNSPTSAFQDVEKVTSEDEDKENNKVSKLPLQELIPTLKGHLSQDGFTSDHPSEFSETDNETERQSNSVILQTKSCQNRIAKSENLELTRNLIQNEESDEQQVKLATSETLIKDESREEDDTEVDNTAINTSEIYKNSFLRQEFEDMSCEEEKNDLEPSFSDSEIQNFECNYDSRDEEEMFHVEQDEEFSSIFEESGESEKIGSSSDGGLEKDYSVSNKEPTYIDLVSSEDEEEPTSSGTTPIDPTLISTKSETSDEDKDEGRSSDQSDDSDSEEDVERDEEEQEIDQKSLTSYNEQADTVVGLDQNNSRSTSSGRQVGSEQNSDQGDFEVIKTRSDKNSMILITARSSTPTVDEIVVHSVECTSEEILQDTATSYSQPDNLQDLFEKEKPEAEKLYNLDYMSNTNIKIGTTSELSSTDSSSSSNNKVLKLEGLENFQDDTSDQSTHLKSSREVSFHEFEKVTDKSQRNLKSDESCNSSDSNMTNSTTKSYTAKPRVRGHDANIQLALSSHSSPSKRQSSPLVEMKVKLARTLRTELSEFSPLKLLRYHMKKNLDLIAIVTSCQALPIRVRGGPRDFLLTFNITDPTIAPNRVIKVQIFRPDQEALPIVEIGDGILLRNFLVTTEKKNFNLRSKKQDGSSWAVFKSTGDVQIRGPPVEYSTAEKDYISKLQTWYCKFDTTAQAKITRANAKIGVS